MPTKYCPKCTSLKHTKVSSFDSVDYAKSNTRNWVNNKASEALGDSGLQICYFIRKLECLACGYEWTTMEFDKDICDKLIKKIIELNELVKYKDTEKSNLVVFHQEQLESLNKEIVKKGTLVRKLNTKLITIHNVSKLLEEI